MSENPLLWMVREVERAGISIAWADDTPTRAQRALTYLPKLMSEGHSALESAEVDALLAFIPEPRPYRLNPAVRILQIYVHSVYLPLHVDDFDTETGQHEKRIRYVLFKFRTALAPMTFDGIAVGAGSKTDESSPRNPPCFISR